MDEGSFGVSEAEADAYDRALHQPGGLNVFIDDSGGIVRGDTRRVLAAVVIESEKYTDACAAVRQLISDARRLTGRRVDRLHASKFTGPRGKKHWKRVGSDVRLNFFGQTLEIVGDFVSQIRIVSLDDSTYGKLLEQARALSPEKRPFPHTIIDCTGESQVEKPLAWDSPDLGLQIVFLKALVRAIDNPDSRVMAIIADRNRHRDNVIMGGIRPANPVRLNGVVYAPSTNYPGLQIADLVAYCVNRSLVVQDRAARGEPMTEFDRLLDTAVGRFPTVKNVFAHLIEADQATDVLGVERP